MHVDAGLSEAWGKIFLDGRLVEAGSAEISPFDRGLLYGDGIYETLRVYAGRPFMLDAHLERMRKGCEVIGLAPPDSAEVSEGVRQVLEANALDEAYLRITVTRGATGHLWFDLSAGKPTIVIFARPFARPDFTQGLRLAVSRFRSDERSPLSGIKQVGILQKILARWEAVQSGADDAILLDTRGFVSEGTSSNAFWVRDGRLFTPALTCGILPGVTRAIVIELAQRDGIPVMEGEFPLEEMCAADEGFMTSSTWEIAPVHSLNGMEYAEAPGSLTRRITALYREVIDKFVRQVQS